MHPRHPATRIALLAIAASASLLGGNYLVRSAEPVAPVEDAKQVSVETARDRAVLLQNVYVATLHVMHERYFHDERAIVPARALEDVFKELDRQSKVNARWISVNTKPMSISHEPKSAFEKQAAKEIADGKETVELVENGLYQSAVAIPLSSGCVSCHTGFFGGQPKSPRYAALVISMPVSDQ